MNTQENNNNKKKLLQDPIEKVPIKQWVRSFFFFFFSVSIHNFKSFFMVLYFTCVLWKLVCDALDNHSPFLLLSIMVRILLLEPTTSTGHHSITFPFIRSFIPWILLCPLNTTQSFTVLSHGITHITFLDYLPWAKCYRATSSIFKGQKKFFICIV